MLCINYEVMTDPQEQENYLRMLFLVFDVGTSMKRSILENHLIKNGLNSFEDFIDKNQHDIYHYFDNRKCCLCMTDMSSMKTVLLPHQIQLIFDINRNQRKCGHRYGKNNRFCCLKAANISLKELDFTLLRFFIINFCDDVIWDDCLQSYNNNFETFVDREKHDLYHMWKSNTACCLCRTGYVPPKQCIQSDKQYQLMFQFIKNSCNDDTCGYSVLPGLTYEKLKNDDKLLFINLTNAFCPLRKAIETITNERNKLAHASKLRLDQTSFDRSWNDVSAAIERIASATTSNTLNDVRKNISDIKEQHFDVRLCLHNMHKLEKMLRDNQNMQDIFGAIENLVEDLKETGKRLSQLEKTVQHNMETVQQNTEAVQHNMETVQQNTEAVQQIREVVQHNAEAVQQITEAVQQNTEVVQQNREAIEKVYALLERRGIKGIVSSRDEIEITTQDPPASMTPSVMSAVRTSASNLIGWCLSTARKILYKKDEDKDSFKCGPCGSEFNRIEDFLAHKDMCVRRTKTKKYTSDSSNTSAAKDKILKVTVRGIGETWEKQTVEYSRENKDGLNVDGAEVLYGELGSLTFWIKSSATSLASKSGLVSLVNSFLKNLLRTSPVKENKTIPVEVNVEIFEEISDADEEGDIYRCGQCNCECSSFTSFLRHKTDKCQTHQETSNPYKDIVPISDSLAEHPSFQSKNWSSMITQEQENFYRHSTVTVDETKDSFLHLLDFHLTNQGITLQKFIEINGHDIYHQCFNRYPCCQCPPGPRAETKGRRVLHRPQLDILFDKTGTKLPVHNSGSKSAPNCCCPVNPNLQLQDLDFTLARILLVNFTKLVPEGSPERIALDFLDNSRNHSLAHAKEGKMSNSEYQKSIEEIEKSLLVLAKVYGKETETKQRYDIAKQPLDSTIYLQLQSTLFQQCQIDENEDYVPAQKKFKGLEGIEDTRFKHKCHVCDKEPSVYWCHGCQRSMCHVCYNQHRKSTATKYHIVQHVQDMYSLDYKFNVKVKGINDIKVLHDDVLVIADWSGNQLVTCYITGQQQHTIKLPGEPFHIAVVDNNTVAVTLLSTTVVIVDVRQRQVIQHTDVKVECWGIMYRDNQLFVGCGDRTIKVMNMSGEVTRTITVDVMPWKICGGETGRIYYTSGDKLYCIDTLGNTLFTFTDPNMSGPWGITTDDEGHVLVICYVSKNVLRISPDGKQSQVIITQIPSDRPPYICYNSLSKSVVIGCRDNVNVYKKV